MTHFLYNFCHVCLWDTKDFNGMAPHTGAELFRKAQQVTWILSFGQVGMVDVETWKTPSRIRLWQEFTSIVDNLLQI